MTDRELTERERAVLIAHGQNPDWPPRGMTTAAPELQLRGHVCEVDGHSDPDLSGMCIYCCLDESAWSVSDDGVEGE